MSRRRAPLVAAQSGARVLGRGESRHARRRQGEAARRPRRHARQSRLPVVRRDAARAGAAIIDRPTFAGRSTCLPPQHDMALSLDLIFGVPGQTAALWDADLSQVLAFEPDGIATYGLTYEKGTRLWKQERAGQVQPVGEDIELAFYERAHGSARRSGLRALLNCRTSPNPGGGAGTIRSTGPTTPTTASAWERPSTSTASAPGSNTRDLAGRYVRKAARRTSRPRSRPNGCRRREQGRTGDDRPESAATSRHRADRLPRALSPGSISTPWFPPRWRSC